MKHDNLKKQYNSLYGASDTFVFGGGEATKVVQRIPQYVSAGGVLDIGGGDGRNAIYLAELGYTVHVVDISDVGIVQLQEIVEQKSLKITAEVGDVTEMEISEEYEAVIFSFVFHHLGVDDSKQLINQAQSHTNNSGVHVIATFSDTGALAGRNEGKDKFYPSLETLEALYEGWTIEESGTKEISSLAKDKQGNNLRNEMITFVARNV